MTEIADTLRASGKFPIGNGWWTNRQVGATPAASSLPSMTCIVDPYGRWIRTDGTHWDLVGVAPNVIHLDPGACALDVGAAINTADARLGATPGVIVVPDGGPYEWTTSVALSSDRVLMIGLGTYNLHNRGNGAIYLDKTNRTYIVGRGWGTVFNESDQIGTDGTGLACEVIRFNSDNSTGNDYGDCQIVDLAIEGSGVSTTLAAGAGASAAINLSNAKRCRVRNVKIVGTHYIGVAAGGPSPGIGGDYGDSVTVENCFFDNIQAVYVAGVNVSNFRVINNGFLAGANSLSTAIDMEANIGSDRLQNFVIADNSFDVTDQIAATWFGISVQGGLDSGGDNPDTHTYYASDHGVIANNQFYGYRGGVAMNYAVFLTNCKDILVANNNSRGGGKLEFENCLRCVASNNRFRFPSATSWVTLLNSSYCIVDGNWFFNAGGEINASNNQIIETGSSDFNIFKDNYVSANAGNQQHAGAMNANISLSGAHSREWDNYLGEVPDGFGPGAAGRTVDGVFVDMRGIAPGQRPMLTGGTIKPKPATSDNECGVLPVQPAGTLASYLPSPAVRWGVRFTASEHGWLRAVRFYKDPADATTTHTITLWDNANSPYGVVETVATSGESASGWQTMVLAQAFEIKAGKAYTVAIDYDGTFQATYKSDSSYPYTRGPLTVSGAYSGSIGAYPNASTGAANQPLVDVVFVTANGKSTNVTERLNTTTGAEDVLAIANPQPGNWLIGCTFRVVTASTTVAIVATWKDANNATQTATLQASASKAVGTYTLPAILINTDAIVAGSLKVTATAGTANQLFVSASASLQ